MSKSKIDFPKFSNFKDFSSHPSDLSKNIEQVNSIPSQILVFRLEIQNKTPLKDTRPLDKVPLITQNPLTLDDLKPYIVPNSQCNEITLAGKSLTDNLSDECS